MNLACERTRSSPIAGIPDLFSPPHRLKAIKSSSNSPKEILVHFHTRIATWGVFSASFSPLRCCFSSLTHRFGFPRQVKEMQCWETRMWVWLKKEDWSCSHVSPLGLSHSDCVALTKPISSGKPCPRPRLQVLRVSDPVAQSVPGVAT